MGMNTNVQEVGLKLKFWSQVSGHSGTLDEIDRNNHNALRMAQVEQPLQHVKPKWNTDSRMDQATRTIFEGNPDAMALLHRFGYIRDKYAAF